MAIPNFLQKSVVLTAGTIASFAIAGGMSSVSAQTALFTSTATLSGTTPTVPSLYVPLATTKFSYQKTELSPQSFGYTLLSLEASVTTPYLNRSYTLADLPKYAAEIQLLTALIPTSYQSLVAPYLAALNNILDRTSGFPSNQFDYIGDGDFPPADISLTFTNAEIPTTPAFVTPYVTALFPQGGKFAFSSTVEASVSQVSQDLGLATGTPTVAGENVSAVPEPTTMLGAGLAAGVAAIARRRKKKQAA